MNLFGMGCWQIGGPALKNGKTDGWAYLHEADVESILGRAVSSGISFFDTAPTYGKDNRSEHLLGKYLPKTSEIQISTKFGWKTDNKGNSQKDFSVSNLHRSLESSLKCLKTNQIDTLLLHGFPDSGVLEDALLNALENLRTLEVIKHWGVSPSTFSQVKICLEKGFGDTIEWVYNLLDRRIENLFSELNDKQIRLIVRSPFASGLIKNLALENAHGKSDALDDFSTHHAPDIHEWFKYQLKNTAIPNQSIKLIALRFFLDKPVFKVIPGIRNTSHVNLLQQALESGPLSSEEQKMYIQGLPESYPSFL
jgi:aryl-alcohol dehydrogenase-like predicted oxidoreductase